MTAQPIVAVTNRYRERPSTRLLRFGLKGVTAHDLRRGAATHLDAVGVPEQLMHRRLGSSDITPRVYSTSSTRPISELLAPFGELVWQPTAGQQTRNERAVAYCVTGGFGEWR